MSLIGSILHLCHQLESMMMMEEEDDQMMVSTRCSLLFRIQEKSLSVFLLVEFQNKRRLYGRGTQLVDALLRFRRRRDNPRQTTQALVDLHEGE